MKLVTTKAENDGSCKHLPGSREEGSIVAAEKKLAYGKYTENLIEIVMVYARLVVEYPKLLDTDSISWKQEFVCMANRFEEEHLEDC